MKRPRRLFKVHLSARPLACPWCGKRLNAHSPADGGGPPGPGSYLVCSGCTRVARFTAAGCLVRATAAETAGVYLQEGGTLPGSIELARLVDRATHAGDPPAEPGSF